MLDTQEEEENSLFLLLNIILNARNFHNTQTNPLKTTYGHIRKTKKDFLSFCQNNKLAETKARLTKKNNEQNKHKLATDCSSSF